jgi:hypothetical protein
MKAVLRIVAFGLILPWIGCVPNKKPETPEPAPHPQALFHSDTQIRLFDTNVVRSKDEMHKDDLRPVWIVSGRLENHTQYFIDEVWIAVTFYNTRTGKDADSSVIKMEHLRLPPNNAVVAFSRSTQMLPPSTDWGWRCEIIQALTEAITGAIQQ